MKPGNFWKEKKREKSLVSAIIFYYSWGAQVAFRSFQTSTGFASDNPTVCWSCRLLGFNTETTELQSVLWQTIEIPVATNSFPALSSPAHQSDFCSLSFKARLCRLKERGCPSQMHFFAASTLPHPNCYSDILVDSACNLGAQIPQGDPWLCLPLHDHLALGIVRIFGCVPFSWVGFLNPLRERSTRFPSALTKETAALMSL